jgi:biopolymer transport protein ExbD
MALAGVRQIEKQIAVDLPGPGRGIDIPIVIDITGEGVVLCNGLELMRPSEPDSAKLNGWLVAVATADPDATVIIRPANDAQHGHFIQVLASLRGAGLKRISFS